MNHEEKYLAIRFIKPNAEFVLRGTELEWLDSSQAKPSDEEIANGWLAYESKTNQDKAESASKRQALLAKLGITEEEAKLLLS